MTTTDRPTCPHPFTEANCASGSFREIEGTREFVPMPSVCENCKIHACDDCAETWPGTCVCCGGGICGPCAANTRSRRVTEAIAMGAPYRTHTEFLCDACAKQQDAAIKNLATELAGMGSDEDSRWLSDIVTDMAEVLRNAKDAL